MSKKLVDAMASAVTLVGMQQLRVWGLAGVCFAGVACSSDGSIRELPPGTRSRNLTIDHVALEAARSKVRAYFDDQRAKMDIVATTTTKDGTTIDWVAPTKEQLLAAERIKALAGPPEPLPPLPDGVEYAKSPLELDPEARGPAGTIPHVRPDIDGLLEEWGNEVPSEPQKIFDIMPAPNPDGRARYYGEVNAFGSNGFLGMTGRISIWEGDVNGPNDASFMQTAMVAGDSIGNNLDTIESGVKSRFGSTGGHPQFFVYTTNSNYSSNVDPGYCPGGYVTGTNHVARGWHQGSEATWLPEMFFPDVSTIGGTVYAIHVKWNIDPFFPAWFLKINNVIQGFFDLQCKVSGVFRTMFHSTDGLAGGAQIAKWYGEVYNSTASCTTSPAGTRTCTGATTTDMGNGLKASNANAAWFDQMSMRGVDANGFGIDIPYGTWTTADGVFKQTRVTDSNCYSVSTVTNNKFRLGGGGTTEASCD